MKMMQFIVATLVLALGLTGCDFTMPTTQQEALPVDGMMEVHFIDVGQADAALLLCDGQSMLIDGGNVEDSSLIVSYLEQQGVSHLDYVVGTHAHEDHIGGLSGALAVYGADYVYTPVLEYSSKAFSDFIDYAHDPIIPEPGDTWMLGAALVTVVAPLDTYTETNDTSIVLRIDHGENAFLFTGDAEKASEDDMMEAWIDLSVDVLKVGHHGGNTSSSAAFLDAVGATYGVISCGVDNSYGHPHDEVMNRLADANVFVYRTDMQGTVVATSDGTDIQFEVEKNADVTTNTATGTVAVVEDYYIGNANSQVLHRPSCSSLPAEHNQIIFESLDDALSQGFTCCSRCNP